MKISYNWLKKFIDFKLSPQELASLLTSLGIEASVVSTGCAWSGVITAKVLDVCKHPNADNLTLCKVSDGLNEYSIVCGAKNIAAKQIVPLAKIGAVLPGDFKIRKFKIRGIASEGMICSESELGLKEKSEGILILCKNTETGIPLENVLGDIDAILEIEITINRGDCLSHLGIAREISAKLRKDLVLPSIKTFDLPPLNWIELKSDLCSRYIGSVISGVKVAPSPKWISDALIKCAIRPINNIVDATNYVMIELGQPLHAFDMAKLASKKVNIRKAEDCERIEVLDGKEYKLDSETLVVADDKRAVAIAGVMGGGRSSVDETTKVVFLESAIFDVSSIRKTSKKLNLSSDSSYRFERGLDWNMVDFASWRAANLIVEIAGGKIEARGDMQRAAFHEKKIALRIERIAKILGYCPKKDEIAEILRYLGIDLQLKEEIISCVIPSWRNDINEEVDLIEEIARVKGYDAIPSSEKQKQRTDVYVPDNSFLPVIVEKFRAKLNGLGFSEALNYSFAEISDLKKFDLQYCYKIANPISNENEVLRPSLLPALYKNLTLNISQGFETVVLFEYGKVFNKLGERKTFAAIMYGKVWKEWWKWSEQKFSPEYDFYFGSGIVRNILSHDTFGIAENFNPESYYHSGKTASIVYDNKPVGHFGVLKPSLVCDIKGDAFYFEIDLEAVENARDGKKSFYKAYSKFPAVKRDISIVADKSLQFVKIENVIKNIMDSDGILKEYALFSVYFDESKLGEGKIGYSLRLSYRNNDRTLTDDEVNEAVKLLLQKLNDKLGVKLRQ